MVSGSTDRHRSHGSRYSANRRSGDHARPTNRGTTDFQTRAITDSLPEKTGSVMNIIAQS